MVGGYLYPFKTLKVGSNDLEKMFGSTDAVAQRISAIQASLKPMFVEVEIPDTGIMCRPVTSIVTESTIVTFKAGQITAAVDMAQLTATVSVE